LQRNTTRNSARHAPHLLAPVAHRQVVLTVPKRLRAYFLPDRRRLGVLSRVDARTVRDYIRSASATRCRA
jgi:hypothetical protein